MNYRTCPLLLLMIFCLVSCREGYVRLQGYAQGGTYSVIYNSEGVSLDSKQMQEAVDSILNVIDTTFSGYNSKSQLSRYNRGELQSPSPLFALTLRMARNFYDMTGGAVDAGSAPLYDIWGFGFKNDSLPSDSRIAEAMALSAEWKQLNFNSFAQGLSCDLVASFLRDAGVRDMLVDIGEIYCCGRNPKGEGWKVGIDNPVDGNNNPGADLHGIWDSGERACGVVTSGNYRKFYVVDGVKYSHTIDPRSGYPVTHSLLSATIVAPTAAEADALATYCMVIGPDAAREYIESRPDIEGYLISADGDWVSEGFTLN